MCKNNYQEETRAGQAVMGLTQDSSPLHNTQYEVNRLEERLSQKKRALDFLSKHPEFAEFIELQRQGCF